MPKNFHDLNEALSLIGGERGMQESLSACLRRLEKIAPQAAGSLDDAVKALERALVGSMRPMPC